MATLGMDPSIGNALSQLATGVSGLPDQYAAGQRHLLQVKNQEFDQFDKDRNFRIREPLIKAQTDLATAKGANEAAKGTAVKLYPELFKRALIPIAGVNGEPNRIGLSEDPEAVAALFAGLTAGGTNPNTTVQGMRNYAAGQYAASPTSSTNSAPSFDRGGAAARIGSNIPLTTGSVASAADRDKVLADKEAAAMKRSELAAATSRANNSATIEAANDRAVLGATVSQETAANSLDERARQANNRGAAGAPGSGGGRVGGEYPVSADTVSLVMGDGSGLKGFANNDVDARIPQNEGEPTAAYTARTAPEKEKYARKFYEVFRLTRDAAKSREAARATIGVAEADSPASTVSSGATPAAVEPYSPVARSNPSQVLLDAQEFKIANQYGMTLEELRNFAAENNMTVQQYIEAVNTPAQEAPVEPEAAAGAGPTPVGMIEQSPSNALASTLGAHQSQNVSNLIASVNQGQGPMTQTIGAIPGGSGVAGVPSRMMPDPANAVATPQVAQPAGSQVAQAATGEDPRLTAILRQRQISELEQAAGPQEQPASMVAQGIDEAMGGTQWREPAPVGREYRVLPDPMLDVAPGRKTGDTWETSMLSTPVDNSDAILMKGVGDRAIKARAIEIPKESVLDTKTYKPSDYLYSPDAVEQYMQSTGIDRKSAFGRRIEEMQREKFSLMNSVAGSGAGGVVSGNQYSAERLSKLNREIEELTNSPLAKVSPSAALMVKDFVEAPGLVVNSLSDVQPENQKYVLKQSEVIQLLNTFTNVTPKADGTYSVMYPIGGQSESSETLSRVYSDAAEAATSSQYVDGERMFAAFDRAHPEIVSLFIRQGKLGMKPGDSLARTLVNLRIKSNLEIAKSGSEGKLDEASKPSNWFQGAVQSTLR